MRPRNLSRAEVARSAAAQPLSRALELIVFVLPFAVLAAVAYVLRASADPRTWSVLVVGFTVLLVLAAVGPLQRGSPGGDDAPARRVLLRALFGTMLVFALCCGWIAWKGLDGALDVWPAIIFVPAFIVFALLIPLWTGSPVIRTDEPPTGWKSLGEFKLAYADPADSALWVYMSPQISRDYRSSLYTPNLGHPWGRAAMITFIVLIVAMVVILVAASRRSGLLP